MIQDLVSEERETVIELDMKLRRYLVSTLKGGPGKTTTAWHLLWAWSMMGYKAVGIDADPSSKGLQDCYGLALAAGTVPFTVIPLPEGADVYQYAKQVEEATAANRIVIDTGGEDFKRFVRACLWCNQLVCPVGPKMAEIRRMPETYDKAMEAAALHEFEMAVLLTRVPAPHKGSAVDARILLDSDEERSFHVLDSEVRESNAWHGNGAWGKHLTDLHDYAYVVNELEGV